MMKFQLYLLVSVSLAVAVICRALFLRPNFWSASILLASSNGSLILLTNVALITTGGFVWALQRLLYGPLRPIEVEQLYEKGWMAVTETLLSLTIFREDIGTRFFVMFLALMAGKVWEWIGEGRVEFLEQQPPANPLLFHSRLTASLTLSVFFDCFMLGYCLRVILQQARPGMMVMYGFEFTILSIQSVSLMLRYILTLAEYAIVKRQTAQRIEERRAELRREREAAREAATANGNDVTPEQTQEDEVDENEIDVPGWEDKGRYIFYLDLVTDFIKSIVYCGFFVILLVFHGLPIHIMRDLYITVRSFCKRIMDFIQYRQATKNMNERYSDATVEDLQADNTCIICREEMIAWGTQGQGQGVGRRPPDERQRAKKLPCGHILHFSCLRSWLERQRVCPTCRRPVLSGSDLGTNNGNAQNQQNRGRPNNDRQIPPAGGAFPANARGDNGAQNQGPNPGRQPGFRVYNFGPLRIALGQGNQNNNEVLNNIARQQQDQQQNNRTQSQSTNQQDTGRTHHALQNVDNQTATNPALIHHQIVQLQSQVLHLMRQLNGERANLDVLERLVAELMRLQNEQGIATDPSQVGSNIGHYRAQPNDGPRAADDVNLPPGMILPPGFTLQRLHPVNTTYSQSSPSGLVPNLGSASSTLEQVQNLAGQESHVRNPTANGHGPTPLPPRSPSGHASNTPTSSSSGWAPKENAPTQASSSSASTTGESSGSSVRQRNPLAASAEDAPASRP